VLLQTTARDLLLLSWPVEPGRVARTLPPGVEPALDEDGRALVSLVGLRNTGVRAGALPGPAFSQVTVRTYAICNGEPGVFVLGIRVALGGLPGIAFGVPIRPGRVRARAGRVVAPGVGVDVRYRVSGAPAAVPAPAGVPLGAHDVAFFLSAGLRRLQSRHEPIAWRAAEIAEPPRTEPVLALGFDVREPASILYADGVRFEVDLPPGRVADSGA
jgi:uncharacterized protein YqjF (DUF2071 family)